MKNPIKCTVVVEYLSKNMFMSKKFTEEKEALRFKDELVKAKNEYINMYLEPIEKQVS